MARYLAVVYALVAYAGFVGWFLYAILFLNDWHLQPGVPKTISDGALLPIGQALAINLGLILLFAVQHTLMARHGFKRAWTRVVPGAIERSTFVLIAAVLLFLVLWKWSPLPETVWRIEQPGVAAALTGLSLLGAGILLYTTFLIDHWDLVGLRQAWAYATGEPPVQPVFKERSFYRWMRHPMMAGILLWFWATPHMTQGRLLFAAAFTIYVFIGIRFEERSLLSELGEDYADYRRRVPLVPRPGGRKP